MVPGPELETCDMVVDMMMRTLQEFCSKGKLQGMELKSWTE
jgi:hypothetical protein